MKEKRKEEKKSIQTKRASEIECEMLLPLLLLVRKREFLLLLLQQAMGKRETKAM
jgi:hypothetical protein